MTGPGDMGRPLQQFPGGSERALQLASTPGQDRHDPHRGRNTKRRCAQVRVEAEDVAVAQAQELLVLVLHHARLPGQPHALPGAPPGWAAPARPPRARPALKRRAHMWVLVFIGCFRVRD